MNRLSPVRLLLVIAMFLLTFRAPANSLADQQQIVIDGVFGDWTATRVAYDDILGDTSSDVDFGRIWLADDDEFLFIRIELNAEVDASEDNLIRLFLDTDADSSTGHAILGIGAELEWNLGSRFGLFYVDGTIEPISASDIQFRGGPTVTSSVFEFAIGRASMPDGINQLFTGSQIRIALDEQGGGDRIPDQGKLITYDLDQGSLQDEVIIPLVRELPSDLRLVTHNVLVDGPWDIELRPKFERLWTAIAPDVFCFQEIYNHSLEETVQLINELKLLPDGQTWHGASNQDCFTISRFPILESWGMAGNLAILLDTNGVFSVESLVINAHLPCCQNDINRQTEIDQIMAFIREAKLPGGSVFLAEDTPVIVCGDLNLVGLAQQLDTLLTGEISDNAVFGPDFEPDWDGSDFASVITRQTEKRMGYTWRNDDSSFWPGQLDFVIYSDSVIKIENNYVLYTPEISDPQSLDLMADDSLASDHLPFVADFRLVSVFHGDVNLDGVVDLLDVGPFVDRLTSGRYQAEADINEDGVVDLLDIGPFVAILTG